ncbi:hypothetical protein BBF93_12655 [Hyphomonas sp. CACIAM 19H1]|nr:hypothetical protein BBF93_12655 [Hyphomonas sp. CACIAM 19H1]
MIVERARGAHAERMKQAGRPRGTHSVIAGSILQADFQCDGRRSRSGRPYIWFYLKIGEPEQAV